MSTLPNSPHRLVEEAIAQRSRCYLSLPEPVQGLQEIACSMQAHSPRGLILESLDKLVIGPHWVGQPVKGYFRVALQRHAAEETFYTFDSSIRSTTASPGGLAKMLLTGPETLLFGQRRNSLRVEPDPDRISQTVIWRYDSRDGFRIDAPALKQSDFQAGLARLANLSAGGLALAVRASLVAKRNVGMSAGQRCILHLQMLEPRVPGNHEFWIVARICHAVLDRISQHQLLGMEFLANGRFDPKLDKIRWQAVEDHAIPELADIFYQWHLDKHRDKST